MLLLQVDETAGLEWLPWLRELLVQMVELASGLARSAPLLSSDPQPALLLDAEAVSYTHLDVYKRQLPG